jgi:serine phosphatase RsbU (regulator of sigma subunit)
VVHPDPTGIDRASQFARLIRESHLLPPHDLPKLVGEHAEAMGFHDATLYLVDLQQQVLVPFLPHDGPGAGAAPSSLGVDSTVAGRAFQQVETASQDDGSGRVRVWVPVLDGTERLGVLSVTVDDPQLLVPSSPVGRALRLLASLVGELVATKTRYGDAIVRLTRTAPMGLGAEIQWSLLPPLTFASRDVSIAAALEPAYEVAGDTVDYAVDPSCARVAVFDGMGHGLHSAQLASLTVAAYRNARRGGQGLVATTEHIEDAVHRVFGGESFITGLLAELDTTTGTLSWVTAGHPPPLLIRHGRLVRTLELEARLPFGLGLGPAPGLVDGSDPPVGTAHLEPEDYMLLYTDGVIEARSPGGELFGVDRLTDLIIRSLAAGLPASESMRRAVHALLEHQGGNLSDDATLLLAQWRPQHPESLLP